MKKGNNTEIILYTKKSARDWREKELLWWLVTSGQSEIARQDAKAIKVYPKNLRDTPAIYLS